jgi:hypothetical protein
MSSQIKSSEFPIQKTASAQHRGFVEQSSNITVIELLSYYTIFVLITVILLPHSPFPVIYYLVYSPVDI